MSKNINTKYTKAMLDKFPGLLGYSGIFALHANWPIYPPGIGWKIALTSLGNFPKGTIFYEVDDIDRCKLLTNQEPHKLSNPFDSKHYHVAVWHVDLIELKHKGLVEGIIDKTGYEFEIILYENLKKQFGEQLKLDENENIIFYIKDDKGNVRETKFYKPESGDDEEGFASRDCAVISNGVCLTENGIRELNSLSNQSSLIAELTELTQPLIEIGRFDTAIRDASLLVESKIKQYHKRRDLFGQKLIEFHISEIIKNNKKFNSAAIKFYRGKLRTIFKFIRNDFAHNFKALTEEECKFILSKISDSLTEFDEVISTYVDKNNP